MNPTSKIDPDTLPAPHIVRSSLYEQVANNIENWIGSRALQPGDRLPSERELCEQFGLSRTVIREAIKTLAERGLVSIQPGRGNFVSRLSVENLSEVVNRFLRFSNETHEDLMEVRELLEVKIAELAAHRAQPEDWARLEAAVRSMEQAQGDTHLYLAADLDFHSALAQATRSGVFVALINSIVDFLHDIRLIGFSVNAYERGPEEHRKIYQAVRAQNPAAAGAAMREHLLNVRQDIETAVNRLDHRD